MRRLALLLLVLLAGCDLFAPRTPEAPVVGGGSFVQPDTPEQVVANLQAAVAELDVQAYRRSLADDFAFVPAPLAARQFLVWSGWDRAAEERYFSTLAAAARLAGGHQLVLSESAFTVLDERRYTYDARYDLTVLHSRPGVPTTLQGRLFWEITQGADGLWRLQRWTDQEVGELPSWSLLKAAFVQ